MTHTNAETVERILELWQDLEPIPPELLDPGIEWVNPPDAVETGTRRGHSGFEGAESAFRRAYSSLDFKIQRFVDRGDIIGVAAEVVVRGRGSGIDVPQSVGLLFTFRSGRIARFEWSNDPEALLGPSSD